MAWFKAFSFWLIEDITKLRITLTIRKRNQAYARQDFYTA
jgi:hypothetical protein